MTRCAWCGGRIVWTETFAAVAPPRWEHSRTGDVHCVSRFGNRWASPTQSQPDRSMIDYWMEKSQSVDWEELRWVLGDE